MRTQLSVLSLTAFCSILLGLAARSSRAESASLSEAQATLCHYYGSSGAHPRGEPSPGSGLHYPPSRQIDILHLSLDVTPDFRGRSIAGQAILRFKPITSPLPELRLDGIDLRVQQASASAPLKSWHATDQEVILSFDPPLPAGQETTVTLQYSAVPKRGLYFRTPELGYPAADAHLWTQGEPSEARHWFPCYDFPNEKFTSEVTCRVPEGMVALSNGKKLSETKDPASGLIAVRWLQDKPHANYLICLVAGYLKSIEDKHRDIPLAFHTPASQIAYASNSFFLTKDMMAFFEEEIGVPYPWDKYDQACVMDFHWGGMENTTLTVLNDRTLHTADTENLQDSQGLVAHELAHQWFGDLLTCQDWSHLWLNEGFATYYEALYDGHRFGRDHLLYRMHQNAQGILNQFNDTNAIVRRNFRLPEEQFGFLAYPKGSWILHMLRSQLGPELYRTAIRTYVQRHQFGIVETEDLVRVFEELTGQSFDRFFDQYVYHAHHPELAVQYSYDASTQLAKINVQQRQKTSDNVLLFRVPLTLRFKTKSGLHHHTLDIQRQAEDFYVHLPEAPEIVRVDPDLAILAKIDFQPPSAMLYLQLADPQDMLGRLMAVDQLGQRRDQSAVPKLKDTLLNDPFFGVRLEASKALRAIGTDEAFEVLRSALTQTDARVRHQVVRDLATFYREASYKTLTDHLKKEKNPEIQGTLLQRIAAYHQPEIRDTLLTALITESYRNALAEDAIQAMQAQDDPGYIAPLLEYLQRQEKLFPNARTFGRALGTLAFLAREEHQKDLVRAFLLHHLENPKEQVRIAAINALGTLQDDRALAALETFTAAPKQTPERDAAEQAIRRLRSDEKASADVSRLRTEVLEMQRQNRQLQQQFDELKKKVESLPAKTPASPPESKPSQPAKKTK